MIIFFNSVNKTKEYIYFFIIFFVSLQSYFFTKINLAPFPPLAFFLLLFLNTKINKKYLNILFLIFIVFFISSTIGFINNNYYLYLPTFLGTLIGPLFLFLFININFFTTKKILNTLKKVIIIHLFFFYIQLIIFYSTGFKIDFLYYITGEMSRNEAFGVISDFFRPSGLLNEPATYSLFIFGFTSIYFWGIKKINFLIILSLLSLLMSFSASGIILFLLLILFIFSEFFSIKLVIIVLSFLVTLFLIFSYNFSENIFILYFQNRFANGLDSDGSSSQRFTSAFEIFSNSNFKTKILGYGIGYTPKYLDTAVGSGISSHLISFGFLFNFILIILFYLILKNVKLKYFIFFFVMLTTTMTYNVLHYWLFLGLIIKISNLDMKTVS